MNESDEDEEMKQEESLAGVRGSDPSPHIQVKSLSPVKHEYGAQPMKLVE